jgi:hypothetical protein
MSSYIMPAKHDGRGYASLERRAEVATRVRNLVVARYRDGRIIKGTTYDFGPQKKTFHVVPLGEEGRKVSEVLFSDLKAVFFVKSLEGKQDHPLTKDVSEEKGEPGTRMKVKITFLDGETLMGTTQGYTLEREGFFIVPLEEDSNNLRIFVISKAVKTVDTWK